MKTYRIYILAILFMFLLYSCSSLQVATMTSAKMNKLELGMAKEQVVAILGNGYTIAEKRLEGRDEIEVLSYRDYFNDDEFYMFIFRNQKLEKWYRELQPKEIRNK